jgi:hypothetical protein
MIKIYFGGGVKKEPRRNEYLPWLFDDEESGELCAYILRVFVLWPAIAAVVICVIGVIVGLFIER